MYPRVTLIQCSQRNLKEATDTGESRHCRVQCTNSALTVEHMELNICKNVSPINRLAAKSSCNWWLRGRGCHHSRINKCPLALTCSFFSLSLFSFFFTFFWAQFHCIHTAQTQPWTTGEHSWHLALPFQNIKIHFLQLQCVPHSTVRVRVKWMFSLFFKCWRSCSSVAHH